MLTCPNLPVMLKGFKATETAIHTPTTTAPDDASDSSVREEYQLGFLPIFFYRVDF